MSDLDRKSLEAWADQDLPAYPLTWRHAVRDISKVLLRMTSPFILSTSDELSNVGLDAFRRALAADPGSLVEVSSKAPFISLQGEGDIKWDPASMHEANPSLSLDGVSIIASEAAPEGEAYLLKGGELVARVVGVGEE
jgi:hypothetical protein